MSLPGDGNATASRRRAAFGGSLTTTSSSPGADGDGNGGVGQAAPSTSASTGTPRHSSNASNKRNNKGKTSVSGQQQQQQQQAQARAQARAAGLQPSQAALDAVARAQQQARGGGGHDAPDDDDDDDDDAQMCFICAETATLWALGECGHRTCHTCSIRLRALYKKKECTFCKTELPKVIFTVDAELPYSAYSPTALPYFDSRLGIAFETREQMDDSIALLRFNCPEPTCDDVRQSWPDLKRHVRATHHTQICDLCSIHKRIFAHEHTLYTQKEIHQHLLKDHTQCDFCRKNFYDSDQLYAHCRDMHEECFICIRQGIRHQYHLNYDQLEAHFKTAHFICPHPECLAQKFVVFESEIDLQAHAVEAHGQALSDQKARKEARRIETNFTYQTVGESSRGPARSRRGAGGGGAGAGAGGSSGARSGRDSQPAAAAFVRTAEEPANRANRIVPGLGAAASQAARRAGFGASLTGDRSTANGNNGAQAGTDEETKARHEAVMRQVQQAAGSSEAKVTSFKLAVRSFRSGEVSADDLADQLWNIFDHKEDVAGSIIVGVADLLAKEDAEKRIALMTAWQDLREQQNQFPSLAPLDPSLPATAPRNASSRTFNNRASHASRPAIWDRVERAAAAASSSSSSNRQVANPFPALVAAPNASAIPGLRARASATATHSTAWSTSSSAPSSAPSSANPSRSTTPTLSLSSVARPGLGTPTLSSRSVVSTVRGGSQAGRSSGTARAGAAGDFPALPSSSVEADKRARVRAALGKPNRTIVDDLVVSPGASPGSGGTSSGVGGGGSGAGGAGGGGAGGGSMSWGNGGSFSRSVPAAEVEDASSVSKKGQKKKGKVLLMSHGSMRG